MASAEYRFLSPGGTELESGDADAGVTGGTLVISPASGASLAVPFGKISSISEPAAFTIAVALTDGHVIELTRLGVMRTQLLAELREARAGSAAQAAGVVGTAEVYAGWVADGTPQGVGPGLGSAGLGGTGLGGTASGGAAQAGAAQAAGAVRAEVRVYDDAVLVVGDRGTRRLGFSFIEGIQAENYAVTLMLAGGSRVVISRLGRQAGEFGSLLAERLREARVRTAAFLGSLLPGLDPMSQRSAAALLRDGVAVPAHALDAIHPEISATLLRVATLGERFAAVSALAKHADLAIGFKQAASVRVAATGGSQWHDHAVNPHINEHEAPGGLFRQGLAGRIAAEAVGPGQGGAGGPGLGGLGLGGLAGPGYGAAGYGGYGGFGYGGPFGGGHEQFSGLGDGLGSYWAYRALGTGLNWNADPAGPPHQMTPRADVRRGTLTPPSEDLSALTATGSQPTVLAFALFASSRGRVAYDVLNLPSPVTYVYEADGDARAVINRALDDAGFQAGVVHAAQDGGLSAAARGDEPATLLAQGLVTSVPHGPDWQRQIAGLL